MARVPIYAKGGAVVAHALVDDEDFERVAAIRWYLDRDGYARSPTRREHVRMHRFVLGLQKGDGLVADHRNGDRLDNRRANLQAVTLLENAQRRGARRRASTASRGVHRLKDTGKFQASVRYRGRLLRLGTWDTEAEAAEIASLVRGALMPYSADAEAAAA